MARHPRRLLASIGLTIVLGLAGCDLTRTVVNADPPVPAGPLGPILPAQPGGQPVECRGVPIEQCQSFGSVGDANVVRVIVTCVSRCTPANGEVRIDVLRPNGTTESMGQGTYMGAEEAPVAAPNPVASP